MNGLDFPSVFGGLLKLGIMAGALLYAGLVVTNYRPVGPHPHPGVDWRDPARAIKQWALWTGVKSLDMAVRAGSPVFAMLSEASADVGYWVLRHRNHESQ